MLIPFRYSLPSLISCYLWILMNITPLYAVTVEVPCLLPSLCSLGRNPILIKLLNPASQQLNMVVAPCSFSVTLNLWPPQSYFRKLSSGLLRTPSSGLSQHNNYQPTWMYLIQCASSSATRMTQFPTGRIPPLLYTTRASIL